MIKSTLLRSLSFLRLTDEQNNVSITNLLILLMGYKLYQGTGNMTPEEIAGIIAVLTGYHHKKRLNAKIKEENSAAHKLLIMSDYNKNNEVMTKSQTENALELLDKVNKLLQDAKVTGIVEVSSGYRSAEYNSKIGGAPRSAHVSAQAIDLVDVDSKLAEVITEKLLIKNGLYMEAKEFTKSWVHLQTRPTKRRIFNP